MTGPDKVTIQLNLPALERLLGNDTELEIALRHQIVQEFAKKHLRKILVDDNFRLYLQKVNTALYNEITDLLGQRFYNWNTNSFAANIKDSVRGHIIEAVKLVSMEVVKSELDTLIKPLLEDATDRINRYEIKLMGEANERIKKLLDEIDTIAAKHIDKTFEDRVQSEVQRRLKQASEIK